MPTPLGNPEEKTSLATNSQTTRNDIGGGTSTIQANSTAIIPPFAAPQKSAA